HPVGTQDLAKRLAERRRLAGQYPGRTLDQRDLSAQAAHRLCHLDADGPGAEDEQTAWDGLHPRHLAVRPNAWQLAQAGNWWHNGIGAHRHNHVVCCVGRAVALNHARPGEPSAPANEVDSLTVEPARLTRVGVSGDHEVPPG